MGACLQMWEVRCTRLKCKDEARLRTAFSESLGQSWCSELLN